MTTLRIAEGLSFPIEAVTEKLGFIGRTGSGKTYAAQKLAEELHRAGAQFVALDPVGKWWALRLAGDGKSPAIPIPVFGGLHGDVPLEPTAGKLMADVIVDRGISAVVDVSQFESDAQKARFMADFGNRFFFRKKAAPSAVHLFIEEAQEFVPQNPQRDEALMLHAWTRIQKLGRNFGIGSSLITQRPQEVNKKVLNLTEVLFVFQMTGPQERKTIAWWIQAKGIDEDIAAELPKLAEGCPHVWSPAWLQISRVVRILAKNTYDASSTPKVGRRADVKELAPIDLEKLRTDMAATIERAKAEDPRELRQQIAKLKADLAHAQKTPPAPAEPTVVEVPMLSPEQIGRIEALFGDMEKLTAGCFARLSDGMIEIARLVDAVRAHQGKAPVSPRTSAAPRDVPPAPAPRAATRNPGSQPARALDGEPVTGPEQRILDAIAWIESLGQPDADQAAAAFLAGYTMGGGAWNNPRGRLHTRGLVEYRSGGRIALTEAGRRLANAPDSPLTTQELHARVLERLPGPERRILRVLLEAYPRPISNEDLAAKAGYAMGGGAFANPRGRLRSLGLVEYPTKGAVAARALLFLER